MLDPDQTRGAEGSGHRLDPEPPAPGKPRSPAAISPCAGPPPHLSLCPGGGRGRWQQPEARPRRRPGGGRQPQPYQRAAGPAPARAAAGVPAPGPWAAAAAAARRLLLPHTGAAGTATSAMSGYAPRLPWLLPLLRRAAPPPWARAAAFSAPPRSAAACGAGGRPQPPSGSSVRGGGERSASPARPTRGCAVGVRRVSVWQQSELRLPGIARLKLLKMLLKCFTSAGFL